MRHEASLLSAVEGISRPAFRIARELAMNSRSGLTVRFLAKKLDVSEEEIEYLIDVNGRLFFADLTKVRLVPDGATIVKRISDGLESHGDVPTLFRMVKGMGPHEFRTLEELAGADRPGGKKAVAESIIDICYTNPDSVIEYVATKGFSKIARELFDVLWQSDDGIMPVDKLRVVHRGLTHDIEQGLQELIQGFAAFEMFRFNGEERLVRAVGLLSELRQWRAADSARKTRGAMLKPYRGIVDAENVRGLDFSERVCRLVAAIAAKPARLRGDGDVFREDRRRMADICGEDDEPSLNTCLWIAEGVGWLARVDSELRAGEFERLIDLDRVERHRILFEWLTSGGNEAASRRRMTALLDNIKPKTWYRATDFIDFALGKVSELERPVLRTAGGHWHYVSPSTAAGAERGLARSLEETFLWLGLVDRGQAEGESLFRLSSIGFAYLGDGDKTALLKEFPSRAAQIIVQPNFDIVVPMQDVDPLLAVPLDQFAERASSGQAAVYHLSKDSYTRAVQEGHDGAAFLQFLMQHNRGGGLPPNVLTTLEDWRGGMKRVRLRTVHVLESDDPLVMADLLHRKRFRKHLEPLDPRTVVGYSRISKGELTKGLEKEGFVVG